MDDGLGLNEKLTGADEMKRTVANSQLLVALFAVAMLLSASVARAVEPTPGVLPQSTPLVLVESGTPQAEIVVAERRPRMTTLAALELQHFLRKMSGASLPIVTSPTTNERVRIYIGQSAETDRLGIKADGLQDGSYRIVSGPDRIVLIGRDVDFDATKYPWPLKRNDVERAAAEWAKASQGKTDAAWDFPFRSETQGRWSPTDGREALVFQRRQVTSDRSRSTGVAGLLTNPRRLAPAGKVRKVVHRVAFRSKSHLAALGGE